MKNELDITVWDEIKGLKSVSSVERPMSTTFTARQLLGVSHFTLSYGTRRRVIWKIGSLTEQMRSCISNSILRSGYLYKQLFSLPLISPVSACACL